MSSVRRFGKGMFGVMGVTALAATWAACGFPGSEDAATGPDVLSGAPAAADVSPAALADVAALHPDAFREPALRGGAASLPSASVIGRFEGEIDPFGGESTLRFIPAGSKSAALPGVGRSPRTGSQLVLEQNLDELGYSAEECGEEYWDAKWAEEGSTWRFWLDEGPPRTSFFQRLVNGPPDSDGEDALRFCTEFTLRNISSNSYGDLWLMFDGIALERGYAFVDSVPRRLEGLGGDETDLEYAPVSDRGMFNYGPLAPSEEVSRQWYFYRAPGSALERFRVSGDVVEILHEECGNGEDNNGDGIPDSGCGLGSFQSDCYLDADCLSGACAGSVLDPESVDAWVLGTCEPSDLGGACLQDTDCDGELVCEGADPGEWEPGVCGEGAPEPDPLLLFDTCSESADCESGFCDGYSEECRIGAGEGCAASPECATGHECEGGTCTPVDCGAPPALDNGDLDLESTTFGSVALYSCDAGFAISGDAERTCLAAGVWSGEQPWCVALCEGQADCSPGEWCPTTTSLPVCSPRPTIGSEDLAFQWVPGGSFVMGSPEDEERRTASREAQTDVTLTRPYYVQRTLVTQGQWFAAMTAWNALDPSERTMSGWSGETPVFGTAPAFHARPELAPWGLDCADADCPVENVSWWDALVYANVVSLLDGLEPCYTFVECPSDEGFDGVGGGCEASGSCLHFQCEDVIFAGMECSGYRLMTEAEWERAARGGTVEATYNGPLDGAGCEPTLEPIAWYVCNAGSIQDPSAQKTWPVASKAPNAWGLHDMLGNIFEHTGTWFQEELIGGEDPVGPSDGTGTVMRSGSGSPDTIRAAWRGPTLARSRNAFLGFRLARTAPMEPALDCGEPDAPVNGSVSAPETGFQDIATYACDGGYVLVGDDLRTCLASGEWSGQVPECEVAPTLGEPCDEDPDCGVGEWCPTDTSEARCSPRPVYDLGGDPIALEFQWIPGGEFTMGSPDDPPEAGRASNEGQVEVTLTRDYFVQRTPVTQGQWASVMEAWNALDSTERTMSGWAGATPVFGTEPSYFGLSEVSPNCDDAACPVERVGWWEAVVYANVLSALEGLEECYTLSGCGTGEGVTGVGGGCTGLATSCAGGDVFSCSSVEFVGKNCTGYRLLTEAEWERAARGGTASATYGGNLNATSDCVTLSGLGEIAPDTPLAELGWYRCNSDDRAHPVEGRIPNAWGLHDMFGNVLEWTWAWYVDTNSGGVDPLGPESGGGRVLRGGTWDSLPTGLRAASRMGFDPVFRVHGFGFRLARSN